MKNIELVISEGIKTGKWIDISYKNTKDEKVRQQYGLLSGTLGIITNIILVILKLIIGFLAKKIFFEIFMKKRFAKRLIARSKILWNLFQNVKNNLLNG